MKVRLAKRLLIPKRFNAISLPPYVTYIRLRWWNEHSPEQRLRLLGHEEIHWEQRQRLGTLRFYFFYLVWSIRYGYTNNPLEIEARRRNRHD